MAALFPIPGAMPIHTAEGVTYVPVIADGAIGYRASYPGRPDEVIYLLPSSDCDGGCPNVFLYAGPDEGLDAGEHEPHHWYGMHADAADWEAAYLAGEEPPEHPADIRDRAAARRRLRHFTAALDRWADRPCEPLYNIDHAERWPVDALALPQAFQAADDAYHRVRVAAEVSRA